MHQGGHSAILSIFLELPFVIKMSYYLSLRSLFCLFLSGLFTQGFNWTFNVSNFCSSSPVILDVFSLIGEVLFSLILMF